MQIDTFLTCWRNVSGLERAAKAGAGRIRWLRPAFQSPSVAVDPQKQEKMDLPQMPASTATTFAQPAENRHWPATLTEQLAERFTGKGPWKKRLPQLLETLVALGRARMSDDGRFGASK